MSNYPPPPPPPASYPGAAAAGAKNGAGLTSLITGILSFVCPCLPLVLPIVAIVFGRKGKNLAAQGLASNGGMAKAGYILGIIALALHVVAIIGWIVLIATGHGSFSASASTS